LRRFRQALAPPSVFLAVFSACRGLAGLLRAFSGLFEVLQEPVASLHVQDLQLLVLLQQCACLTRVVSATFQVGNDRALRGEMLLTQRYVSLGLSQVFAGLLLIHWALSARTP
jgi:hypothetical protein